MRRIAITLGMLMCLAACEDDLPAVTLIAHMRVLGARTEVQGDPSRSNPKPGETARITWPVAFPSFDTSDDQLASLFLNCTAPDRYTGVPVCQELIDVATGKRSPGFGFDVPTGCDVKPDSVQMVNGIQLICVTGEPSFDVKTAESTKASRLVQGIICRNGVPQFNLMSPTGASCVKNDGVKDSDFEEISVTGIIDLQLEESEENHNPDQGLFELQIRPDSSGDRHPWKPIPSDDLPGYVEDCSSAPRFAIETNSGHLQVIEIGYPKDKLEDEDLVFSIYATLGEMSHRFTVIENMPDENAEDAPDLTWELSEEQRDQLLDKPTLVRFYITATDGRGGFDYTTREICVSRE